MRFFIASTCTLMVLVSSLAQAADPKLTQEISLLRKQSEYGLGKTHNHLRRRTIDSTDRLSLPRPQQKRRHSDARQEYPN